MTDAAEPSVTATPEELAEITAELEQYRDRLLNDTLEAAKRAKLMKATAMQKIQPELDRIDAVLASLRAQQGS